MKIAEALLILFLAYYLDITEIKVLWLSRIKIWDTRLMNIFSIFSVMAGWIAEMLFMLFLAYIAMNIADYKAYWLMGAPIINPRGTHLLFFF